MSDVIDARDNSAEGPEASGSESKEPRPHQYQLYDECEVVDSVDGGDTDELKKGCEHDSLKVDGDRKAIQSCEIVDVTESDDDLDEEEQVPASGSTSLFSAMRSRPTTNLSGKANKCIVLIDLDCFYVAVERMLNPALIGVPVAVGQYTKGETLIAVSYEAKALGVKRGMFGFQARKVCPQLKVVQVEKKNEKADLTKYRDASSKVLAIATRFCAKVERASVDEFYLDITDEARKEVAQHSNSLEFGPNTLYCTEFDTVAESIHDVKVDESQDALIAAGSRIVYNIRTAIKQELDLDCSAGIAFNKFLAKSIAGIRKPATQIALVTSCVSPLCSTMPIPKARTLGGKLGEHLMQAFNVKHLGDLERLGESTLCSHFGSKEGKRLFALSKGLDDTPVETRVLPKSIGCSKTFPGAQRLTTREQVSEWLEKLATELVERLEKDGRRPTTLSVGAYGLGSRSTSNFNTLNVTLATLMPTIEMLFDRLVESPARWQEIGGVGSLGLNLTGFPEDDSSSSTSTLLFSSSGSTNHTQNKPGVVSVAGSHNKWICPSCTFENEPKWLRCEACGSSKSGSVPRLMNSATKELPQQREPPANHTGLLKFASRSKRSLNKNEEEIRTSSFEGQTEDDSSKQGDKVASTKEGLFAFVIPSTGVVSSKKTKLVVADEEELPAKSNTNGDDDDDEIISVGEPTIQQQPLEGMTSSITTSKSTKYWMCRVCTYASNDFRFLRCEMCDSLKSNNG